MDQLFLQAAQLGGTVFVTVAFIWYLSKRDKQLNQLVNNHMKHQEKSNLKLSKALQSLTLVIQQYHKAVNSK